MFKSNFKQTFVCDKIAFIKLHNTLAWPKERVAERFKWSAKHDSCSGNEDFNWAVEPLSRIGGSRTMHGNRQRDERKTSTRKVGFVC